MLDAAIGTQPVISRFARSKDHLLSSFFDNTSKFSLLGHANPLGLLSSHRRVNSDLETSPPSFRDYLLLSGGGLEPAFKFSPDAHIARATRNSSSCTNSSLTLKESSLSRVSTREFSDEESDLELRDDSCPVPLLTPPATPPAAPREVPNSISSVFSILISTIAAPKTTRRHHLGSPKAQVGNVKECNQLRFVSIMSTPSSRMQFSESPSGLGHWDDGYVDQPATIFEMKFSPPSFIRPRGRKLVARREPSPMIYTHSRESLQHDDSEYVHVKEGRDEGIALSRTPVERDVIPEEDEALEESQMSQHSHAAHQDQMGFHDQMGRNDPMAHHAQIAQYDHTRQHSQSFHHDHIPHHSQSSHHSQGSYHSQMARHTQISHHAQTSQHSLTSHHSQMAQHGQMPHISEHQRRPELEHSPAQPLAQTPEQERMRVAEEVISDKIAQQIDSIVEAAALDDNSRSEWRVYMENYSKVISLELRAGPPHISLINNLLIIVGKLQHFHSPGAAMCLAQVTVPTVHFSSHRGGKSLCVQ